VLLLVALCDVTIYRGQGFAGGADTPSEVFLYAPFRNTRVTVIVLFAIYLIFEFKTLPSVTTKPRRWPDAAGNKDGPHFRLPITSC